MKQLNKVYWTANAIMDSQAKDHNRTKTARTLTLEPQNENMDSMVTLEAAKIDLPDESNEILVFADKVEPKRQNVERSAKTTGIAFRTVNNNMVIISEAEH